LAAAITADGRILLAPATVDGVPCLRACFVNHRTTEDDVRSILEVVRELAARIAAAASS
jgi:aromatic-L-amino-acid decarboxylase